MAETTEEAATSSSDITQIKLARIQKVAPFLLVKHVPTAGEKGEKKVLNCRCSVCKKSFTTVFNLHRHLKRVHKLMVFKLPNGEFVCDVCQRSYASKKNLASHFSTKHRTSEEKQKAAITCPECRLVFRQREILRNHIADAHGVVFESKEFTFPRRDEFEKWKLELEKEDNTKYTRFCGKKSFSPATWREYHVCHRTGFFKRKPNVKRRLKQNGSCRIGGTCPAIIIVNGSTESEELQVVLWGQHFGHGPDAPLIRDGQYKRIRNKTSKKKDSPSSEQNGEVRKKRKRGKKKQNVENSSHEDPLLMDLDIQLASSEVIIASEDHATTNDAVSVHPVCIISDVTEVMDVEIEAPVVTRLNVSKIARQNIVAPKQKSPTAKRRKMSSSDVSAVTEDVPVPVYFESEAETFIMQLDQISPGSESDNEDNRSMLLDQINQLRQIVLNKNITHQEESFALEKLNDCIQMFKQN